MRNPKTGQLEDASRRTWLRGAVAFAGLGMTGAIARVDAPARFSGYPFTLGVASGDPVPNGFVIWTRLAPDPLARNGGLDPVALPVHWEVADDERFARIVRSGVAQALPERAHAVHVDVDGLAPDRWYFYRFRCGDAYSAAGRARTVPAAGWPARDLHLVIASCQHYEHGWFAAHRHIAASAPDAVLHLGDYIYEGSYGERVRRFESDKPLAGLDDYRARHAWYKLDRDLQSAHAACPWLPIWDDHEVGNDYAANLPMNGEPIETFAIRRAGAYRAWLEHMPVRAACRGVDTRIHRRVAFGALAELHLLDDRQYRDAQPCVERGGGYAPNIAADCAERGDPARSLLGTAQEQWLHAGLSNSNARWNLIGQQTLMAPFYMRGDDGSATVWSDGWDGYPASRARLLDRVAAQRIPNVVTFGGDVHAFYVTDLKRDFSDERSPPIATEFVTGSLTTADVDHDAVARDLPLNPHVRAFDGRHRGWLDARIAPDRVDVAWRVLDDARNPNARASTLAAFRVDNGIAGIAS